MRFSQFVARSLGVLLALFLGVVVATSPVAADTCLVVFQIANDNDPSWSDEAAAAVGEKFGFVVQACNWHAGAEVVTAKVTMPEYASGKTKATLTMKIGGETQTKEVYLNLSEKSHLVYIPGSTEVTGDFDGDGTKEHNEETWADGMFNGEVSFGTIAADSGVQSVFMVSVEADTRRSRLELDKKISWRYEDFKDFITREEHTFHVNDKVYVDLKVTNTGDGPVNDVKIIDKMPSYMRWIEDQKVLELPFVVGTLEPGQSKSFGFTAIITIDFPVGLQKLTNEAKVYEGEWVKAEDYASLWVNRDAEPQPEVKAETAPPEKLPDLPKAGFGPEPVEAGVVGEISRQAVTTVADKRTKPEWILVGAITVGSLLFAYAGFTLKKTRLVQA